METSPSFNFFRLKHQKLNNIKAAISAKYTTLSQVPRYYLELVTVMAFIGFIYSFIIQGRPMGNLLVTLVRWDSLEVPKKEST